MSADEAVRFLREHAHSRDDLDFWRSQAARLDDPVLDLGAAAGRVALALVGDGRRVWALDRSPAMVDQLERARATMDESVAARLHPVRADMRSFSLDQRFPLIIIAMNTLQALTEPADQLACLRAARRHLAPEGEVIFDVALPDAVEIAMTLGQERDGGSFTDPRSGVTLTHSAWYDTWDPVSQTLEFTHRVRERTRNGSEEEYLRHHRVHLFHPVEMEHLLARAGLETIALHGDFAGGPLGPGAETQIRRCRAVSA
ncbi:MAG TPA: class I SAM-dependent methyltransferase [Miltoncostaeaceae bacterium]|nr:class I SAM-dependent methyltransferase [Miltoncostaeaceae bacterium]